MGFAAIVLSQTKSLYKLTFWTYVYSLLTAIAPTLLNVSGLFYRRKSVHLGVKGNPGSVAPLLRIYPITCTPGPFAIGQ